MYRSPRWTRGFGGLGCPGISLCTTGWHAVTQQQAAPATLEVVIDENEDDVDEHKERIIVLINKLGSVLTKQRVIAMSWVSVCDDLWVETFSGKDNGLLSHMLRDLTDSLCARSFDSADCTQ